MNANMTDRTPITVRTPRWYLVSPSEAISEPKDCDSTWKITQLRSKTNNLEWNIGRSRFWNPEILIIFSKHSANEKRNYIDIYVCGRTWKFKGNINLVCDISVSWFLLWLFLCVLIRLIIFVLLYIRVSTNMPSHGFCCVITLHYNISSSCHMTSVMLGSTYKLM